MDDKESTLEQSRAGLKTYGTLDPYYGAVPPEDVYMNTTGTGYTYPTVTIPQSTWTGANIATPNVYISSNNGTGTDWRFAKQSAKLRIDGDDADIEINGRSLVKILDGIADRLAILESDAEMEAEWEDLRAIREQYEAKLQECREKSRAWKALKQSG